MNTKEAATLVSSDVQPTKKDANKSKLTYLHGKVETIALSAVKRELKTQQRVDLNLDTVEEYKEAISLGAKFPPIKVRFDGEHYWLWDGFHTVQAYEKLKLTEIEAEVTPGTLRDAILDSVSANAEHGLRRSREDKRKAVLTLLYDEEWMEWSNREIARRCKVDHKTVGKIRSELIGKIKKDNTEDDNQIITGEIPSDNPKKYKDRYKNVSVMNTSNIGQKSNTEDDERIITGEKRPHNLNKDKNNTKKLTIVEIISEWRKGQTGIIAQRPDANSAIIEFSDGTRDIFNKSAFRETSTTANKLINQANQDFKRSLVKLKEGDIVIIDNHERVDSRLVGYKNRHAKVTAVNDYTANLKIWNKEINEVSLNDVHPLASEFVWTGVSINSEDYSYLMDNFGSLEEAIDYGVKKKKEKPGFQTILNR